MILFENGLFWCCVRVEVKETGVVGLLAVVLYNRLYVYMYMGYILWGVFGT